MRKFHFVFIIDRSGSMSGLEEDTIGGYNGFLEAHKNKEDTIVSTILFDHETVLLFNRTPLQQAYLANDQYQVRGTTALLDAIGFTLKNIKEYKRLEDTHRKTIYIITTDGQENASNAFTYKEIHRLIKQEQELGNEFVFLAANIDTKKECQNLGIKETYSRSYQSSKKGTKEMFHQMTDMVHKMMESE